MARIELNSVAPDFTLADFNRQSVTLSSFQSDKNVVLVFNRGFT